MKNYELLSFADADELTRRTRQLFAGFDERMRADFDTMERGGLLDLRRCGNDARWCVRVDRHAPAYGEQADYLVVKGY